MNNLEDLKKKNNELPRTKDDLARSYKSKTPVPKNLSKSKAKKPSIRKAHQKSSSPKKDLSKLHKRNSNDFHELSADLLKRTKTKGSKSVELFNHVQESRRPGQLKLNILKLKQKKQEKGEKIEKQAKYLKTRKNSEKTKKKSSSPSDLKSKDKNLDDLINIQNLLKNFQKRKKPTNKRKNQRSVLKEYKNLQDQKILEIRQENRSKLEIFQHDDAENHQVKLDHWLQDSKLSDSLEIFSDIPQDNIVDESEVIPKNFSFINTENMKNDGRAGFLQRRLSRSFELSGKQVEFIQYEADFEEKSFSEPLKAADRAVLSICHQNSYQILRKKVKTLSISQSFLSINPLKKPQNSLQFQSSTSFKPVLQVFSLCKNPIFSHSIKSSMSQDQQESLSIPTSGPSNISTLMSQVSEELTNNINTLFIIEQLKNLELFSNSMLEPHVSPQLLFKFKQFIESKYLAVIHFLQPGIEFRVSQFLSCLDSEATTEFLRKSQKKKEEVKELLADLTVPDFSQVAAGGQNDFRFIRSPLKNSEDRDLVETVGSQVSSSESSESEESSTDEELRALGISSFAIVKPSQSSSPVHSEGPPLVHLELTLVECEENKLKLLKSPSQVDLAEKNLDNSALLKYAEKVLNSLDPDSLIHHLAAPLAKDPLVELDKIQDLQIGTFTDLEIRNFDRLFDYSKALKIGLDSFNEIRDNQTEKIEKSFKMMALDNLNYFFQQFRPFGYHGKPLPWMRKKKFEGKVENIEQVFGKVLLDFEFFSSFCLGRVEEHLLATEDKMVKGKITEKKINRLLEFEIPVEEPRWTDYNFEETQVKIDLADVVLYELVAEVIDININTEPSPTRCKLKKQLLLNLPSANNVKLLPSPSTFQQILNSTPTNIKNLGNKSPSLFSFETANQEELSSILLSNKRGFGKGWDSKLETLTSKTPVNPSAMGSAKPVLSPLSRLAEKFETLQITLTPKVQHVPDLRFPKNDSISLFSKRMSKQYSKELKPNPLPPKPKPVVKAKDLTEEKAVKDFSLSSSEQKSGEKLSKYQGLKMINSGSHSGQRSLSHKHNFSIRTEREMQDLRSFVSGLVEKKLGFKTKFTPNVLQYKKPIKRTEKSCVDFSLLEDSQILSTGYLKYQNDLENKLKVSKMIVKQHKRTRKETQIFFPALKRLKNPDDFNDF